MTPRTAELTLDARRPRDPTGTVNLRRSFRAEAKLRLRLARGQMRVAVMEGDVLALSGYTFHPREVRLRAFADWLVAVVGRSLLAGAWYQRHTARAWRAGEAAAVRELGRPVASGQGWMHVDELAQIELRGIAAAVEQRVAREAASVINAGVGRSEAWRRLAQAFDRAGIPRVSAFADVTAVKAFNGGKVAVYRAADVRRVGVVAETLPGLAHLHQAGKSHARDAFDPSEPRDPEGKWTTGGSAGEGDHPGEGYSPGARVDKAGVIHTSNVYDAQRALFENRKVELAQAKQVSTLIKRLGETAREMAEHGEKAPVFNLCNVSIAGTNLFCSESKGIPRAQMPVIPAKRTKEFIEHLKRRGYKVEKDKEYAAHLRATQDEIDGVKVAASMRRIKEEGFYKRLVVSKDDYILDGHHTWAAQLGVDAKDGNLRDDKAVKVARVDIGIIQLLTEADAWTKAQGIVKKAVGDKGGGLTRDVTPPDILAAIVAGAAYVEEPIDVGVLTAGDDRVCQACEDYAAGSPYDIDEVEDALPLHPNCRCTWFPWDDKRFARDAAFDPGQERDEHGKWTAVGGERLDPAVQAFHAAMAPVLAAHGFKPKGMSTDPQQVHKIFTRGAERVHVYPRHDLGANLWAHIGAGGETHLEPSGPGGLDERLRGLARGTVGDPAKAAAEMKGLWHDIKSGKPGAAEKYAAAMQKRCERIAGAMMLDPAKIKTSLGGSSSLMGGTVLASTDDHTGNITMFARVCTPDAFAGTLVHEATHVKYKAYRNAYRAQKAAAEAELAGMGKAERAAAQNEDGTLNGELAEKYPVFQEFTTFWDIPALQKEGGVSAYSKQWWAKTVGTGKWASSAVYETTAEMARIKFETGALPGGPRHKALYEAMNHVWYTTRPPGFKMIEEHKIGGRDAVVAWLTARLEPTSREAADVAKVVYEDGDVQWVALSRDGMAADWNPDQPRVPEGETGGGQWTSGGAGVSSGGGGAEAGAARASLAEAPAAKQTPFAKKAAGEHKHFKASAHVEEHHARVAALVGKPAARNHTYRWQVSKLIDEAHGFGLPHAATAALKVKLGESLWRQGVMYLQKGKPLHEANALLGKAYNYDFKPTEQDMAQVAALKQLPSKQAEAAVAKLMTPPQEVLGIGTEEIEKPTQIEHPTSIPVAPDNWKKTGGQKGSVSGGTYKDAHGKEWYVKTPKTEAHVNADMLANKLYQLAGVTVAHQVKTTLAGKSAVASEIIQAVKPMGELNAFPQINVAAKLKEGFAVDAWLGNRDVVGLSKDNVLASEEGMGVYRIDFGGALMYRAQGEVKPSTAPFGPKVAELATMRDPNVNPQTSAVFGSMSNVELAQSIDKVAAISEQAIMHEATAHGMPWLAATLIARRQDLIKQRDQILAGTWMPSEAAKSPTGVISAEELALSPEEVAAAAEELEPPEAGGPKATAAELKKAEKAGTFYPPPVSEAGMKVVAPWNAKWAHKTGLTPAELEQKVAEYKTTAAKVEAAKSAEEKATSAALKLQKAVQAKAHAEEKALAHAMESKHAQEVAQIASELGVSPDDADAVSAFIDLGGGSAAKVVAEFKQFAQSGETKGLPISPFQYGLLRNYVGSGYRQVNEQLNKGVWNMRTQVYANAVNAALYKLPSYSETVKRGIQLSASGQKEYQPGHVIYWKAFSSCGKVSSFNRNTQFVIKPLPPGKTRARDLAVVGINPHEAGGEVLYMARTGFKVTKREDLQGGHVKVWLEEVETF